MNIHKRGVGIVENFVPKSTIDSIKDEVEGMKEVNSTYGIRGANKKLSSVRKLSLSEKFINLANSILGSSPEIVRVIYFDKTPNKNWLVTWHQYKTVALNKKTEIQDWEAWSIKDNTHHVQPPLEVLNKMITFRLHLDDADKDNGCLQVIPGSHQLGLLSQSELTEVVDHQEPYLCEVKAGDLVIMKPHIIHSSSKSVKPKHRRVVHIEYSNYSLPQDLSWA